MSFASVLEEIELKHKMKKPEQDQALRNAAMTGTDAGIVMGVNPHASATQRIKEKRGEIEPENLAGKEAVEWGLIHERNVAKKFGERMGLKVQMVSRTVKSKEWPIAHGHIDAKIVGKPWLLEIKTTHEFKAKEWGAEFTEEIPPAYYYQILHYLYCTCYEKAYCAVLIGGNKMRIYEIQRNEKRIEELIKEEKKFWYDYVQGNKLPDPVSADEALLQHPVATEDLALLANPMTIQLHAAIKQKDLQIKKLKEEREDMATVMMGHLQDHSLLVDAAGEELITWKNHTRRNKSKKKMEEALAKYEDVAKYEEVTTSRTFKVI